jgi:hypothetical protein
MWVDLDEVKTITGQEPTVGALAAAHILVALLAGIPDTADLGDTGIVSTTNARHLQWAVAFQAVWLDEHPDALTAMDTTGVSADGVSAQYASAYAAFLGPIPRMCLNRLSWRRDPLRVRKTRQRYPDVGNRDSAVRDDQFVWVPMGEGGSLGLDALRAASGGGQVWSG